MPTKNGALPAPGLQPLPPHAAGARRFQAAFSRVIVLPRRGLRDVRDAPALTILPALLEKVASIRAHDPQGMDEAKKQLPAGIEYESSAYEAAQDAD